jgi:galactosamine-6-phosphate isomerase
MNPMSQSTRNARLVVCESYEDMSRQAADLIVDEVRRKPSLLFCTATGSSPTRAYELLVSRAREEPGLFDRLRILKLDEWGGIAPTDAGTSEVYLRRNLLEPLGVSEDRYIGFRGDAPDLEAECGRIAALLEEQGPIDLCVLGLGVNGHLGFNEPAAELNPGPHVAELSESTLRHPMIEHVSDRITGGVTLGLASILQSKRVVLLVSGGQKREAVRRLLARWVSTDFPASFLWLHGNVDFLFDTHFSDERAGA